MAKGTLAFAVFALYVLLTGIAISLLRVNLLEALGELEAVYQRAEHLTAANAATTQSLLEVTGASYAATELEHSRYRRVQFALKFSVGGSQGEEGYVPPVIHT